jgi:hypothetical protein
MIADIKSRLVNLIEKANQANNQIMKINLYVNFLSVKKLLLSKK